ncbi:hypothetical protein ASPACDRAFT_26030 [Aspergillus aculeatus ATCC 16872]|uniref:Zn(2)-C6 fungal-type domain-containing protein n=1 Tax=Aspergillus aculeatus (strain ATCC 16872 / CBS 172.66 / WB 5094) TaxID=690307 RepID=A0A1L9WZH5_ASPA1|nr:uncharacterized protein ASPACDRAFT_26030 [Aspergillus aculeatus ATCC 16872]OJK01667.1 hypothetical protein ASPACDRAFT_26030 [Aspergillus aculeatus ATCC 16872]
MEPLPTGQGRKSPPVSAAPPRKRRKRTVISQAADDCFTCARQASQCDRRRPYCSQCLDNGRDCAGYKTTLTWGVGVASRGKLRGLSLPVTGAQPAAASSQPRATAASRVSQSTDSRASELPAHTRPLSTLDSSEVGRTPSNPRIRPRPDLPANQLPPHSSPVSSVNQTTSNRSLPRSESLPVSSCHHATTSPSLAPSRWAMPIWPASIQTSIPIAKARDDPGVEEEAVPRSEQSGQDRTPWVVECHAPSLSQQLLARSIGRTPRLRFLISYYAEVIAPMIVAFDGPTNPFRTYVLRLAQESASLQEAIATLSLCNMRQRRERGTRSTERTLPARMSSLAHQALTEASLSTQAGIDAPKVSAREEHLHRSMAVKALNGELADPRQRLSDSVLATLLVLCLFHGCDTGVAQFKTQFAGVTKLLAIRLCNGAAHVTEELKWFIRMFTWLDTMTATTNDRDIQLRGACLDITAISDGEWGLENLAGCNASLFKLIAQLGRLNLLSRSRDTQTSASPDVHAPSTTVPPHIAYSSMGTPGMPSESFTRFIPPQEGDSGSTPTSPMFWAEWHCLRQKLESWRFDTGRRQSSSPHHATTYISPPSSPPSQSRVAPQHLDDVIHISESFRHAAILYSERLAHPDLPSGHPRIQRIVQRTMTHILAVQCDAYLLWPLFITGSECVLSSHRAIIRERCLYLSKDSGFINNLTCLELLEKIWAGSPPASETGDPYDRGAAAGLGSQDLKSNAGVADDMSPGALGGWSGLSAEVPTSPSRRQGFRWHEVMQVKREEGEYMIV